MDGSTLVGMAGDPVVSPDRATVTFHKRPGNEETQAFPALRTLPFPEAVKDNRFHLIGDTRTIVGDNNLNMIPLIHNR